MCVCSLIILSINRNSKVTTLSFSLSPSLLISLLQNADEYVGVVDTFDMEVLSWEPRIVLLRNFLNQEERTYLIDVARERMQRSTVVGGDGVCVCVCVRENGEGESEGERRERSE